MTDEGYSGAQVEAAHGAHLLQNGQMLQRGLDAVLLLALDVPGQGIQLGGPGHVVVGVSAAFAHGVEFTDHQLLDAGHQCHGTAGHGHIIGDHQLIELCLVDMGVKIVLDANVIHNISPLLEKFNDRNHVSFLYHSFPGK